MSDNSPKNEGAGINNTVYQSPLKLDRISRCTQQNWAVISQTLKS